MVTVKNVKREHNTVSCKFVPEHESDDCAGTLTINKEGEVLKYTLSSEDADHYAPYLQHAYNFLCRTWSMNESDIPKEQIVMWY